MDEYSYVFDLRQRKRPSRRSILPRTDPFAIFDDVDFKKRFRMNKNSFNVLLAMVKDDLTVSDKRNNPVVSGDLIGFSQPTISRIVIRVATLLAAKRPKFIAFPLPSEESKLHSGFFKIAGFPGVIGVVDGTHINVKVKRELHERFRNRKNEITLNCQVVFDYTMKFVHLNARWPGSTHDSRIFKHN